MSVRVSLCACAYYIIIYVTRLNLFVIATFTHGNKSKAASVSRFVLSAPVRVCVFVCDVEGKHTQMYCGELADQIEAKHAIHERLVMTSREEKKKMKKTN